tara:strand:+ start:683 stop:1291 length:609 start_codon:yes stop_codon:yes gene_type:complete
MSLEKVKILDENWKEPVKRLLKLRDTHSGMSKDSIDFDGIWNDEYINKYFDPNEPYFLWGYIDDGKLISICGVYKWKLIPRCTTTIFVSDYSVGMGIFAVVEDMWRVHFRWMLENGIKQGFTFSDAATTLDAVIAKTRMQKAKRELLKRAGDNQWFTQVEEVVKANTDTSWTGFKIITGNRKWPIDMVIKSYTYTGGWFEKD